MLAIVAFVLYHFMGRCSCGNGFRVSNQWYDPRTTGSTLQYLKDVNLGEVPGEAMKAGVGAFEDAGEWLFETRPDIHARGR